MELVSAACSRTGFPCLHPSVLLPHPCTQAWLFPGLTDYGDLIWTYLGWQATIQCTQLSTSWNWRGSSLRWQWQNKNFFCEIWREKSKIHFPLKYSTRSQALFFKHFPDCCCNKFNSYTMLSPRGFSYVLKNALVVVWSVAPPHPIKAPWLVAFALY